MTTVLKREQRAHRGGACWRPLELAELRTSRWWDPHLRLREADRHLDHGPHGTVTQRPTVPAGEFCRTHQPALGSVANHPGARDKDICSSWVEGHRHHQQPVN